MIVIEVNEGAICDCRVHLAKLEEAARRAPASLPRFQAMRDETLTLMTGLAEDIL